MVESEPPAKGVWRAVLREFGHTLDEETAARMIGRRTDESAKIVLEKYDLPLPAAELIARRNRRWEAVWREGLPARDGFHELEESITGSGLPWGVATSSPRHYAEAMLEQLGLATRCRAIAAGDEVERAKPAPDVYLLAAQRMGVPPSSCLAFDDSVPGGRAAQAAGMTLVAVPGGQTAGDDFRFADYVFSSLAEVLEQLDALLDGACQ